MTLRGGQLAEPLVSIVIPCFNGARWLSEAIDSALGQTWPHVEVIVVDDGSTDGSLAIAASYRDRIRTTTQERLGAGTARNLGLRLAEGRFVKFLDADDALLPDCVAWQMRASDGQADGTALFGFAVHVDETGAPLAYRAPSPDEGPVSVEWVIGNLINTASPLYRRVDVDALGGFDATLAAGQEYDLNVRLAITGLRFVYRNLPTYRFRQHDQPSRVSMQRAADVFPVRIASTRRHIRLAEERFGVPLPPGLRRAFAHHLWGLGRGALRGDADAVAEQCFAGARSLYPEDPIPGSRQYRLATRAFSPSRIERLSRTLRKLASRE
jgi:glycosyltransferase involved in cell wall biosynthesis